MYDALSYNNTDVTQPGVLGTVVAGVKPQSSPNYASPGSGISSITKNYNGSQVLYFSPQSMYVGCDVAAQEVAAQVPTTCTFSFTGISAIPWFPAVTQTATYTPSTTVGAAPMSLVKFSNEFSYLATLNIVVTPSLGEALTAGHVDNFVHQVQNLTQSCECQW